MKAIKLIACSLAAAGASLFAANYTFGPGTVSADSLAASMSSANRLDPAGSCSYLIFDAASSGKTYALERLQLNNGTWTDESEISGAQMDYGALSVSLLTIGHYTARGAGNLTISGGTLTAASANIGTGNNSLANIDVQSGTLRVNGNLQMGNISGTALAQNALINLNVSGGTFSAGTTSTLAVGESSQVNFNVSGGYALLNATSSAASGTNSAVHYSVSGGTLKHNAQMTAASGTGSSAIFEVSHGTLTLNNLILGSGADSTGTVTASGDGEFYVRYLYTGGNGTTPGMNSTIAISGQDSAQLHFQQNAMMGYGTNSSQTFTMTDSAKASFAGTFDVGYTTGSNTQIVLGGNSTTTVTTRMQLGAGAGATADLVVADNAKLVVGTDSGTSGYINVAAVSGATALMEVRDNATVTVNGYVNVTGAANATGGSLKISGGSLNTAGNFTVGGNSTASGVATISGGELNVGGGYFGLGHGAGADGTLLVSGGAVNATNSSLNVGNGAASSGVMTVSAGSVNAKSMNIGSGTTTSGTVSLLGGELALTQTLSIGNSADSNGFLLVNGGDATLGGVVRVGNGVGADGAIDIRSGKATFSGNVMLGVGNNATGTISVSGGSATFTSLVISNGSYTASTKGVYAQSGGSVVANALRVGYNGLTATTSTVDGTLLISGGSLTVNTYTDVGAVLDGMTASATITVSGSGLFKTTQTLSMMRDSSLVASSVQVGGSAASGVNAQALRVLYGANVDVAGDFTLTENAVLSLYTGDSYNAIDVGGAMVFDSENASTITVMLDFADYTGGEGSLTLATAANGVTGLDAWLAYQDTNLQVSNLDDAYTVTLALSGDAHSLLASISTIPEPSASALLLGIFGLAALARRRR